MSDVELFSYDGYEMPVHLVHLTGAGPETFDSVAQHHKASLQQTVGIEPHHSIVEIGCGIGRDAIPLSKILSSEGRYLGVDIIKPSIDWCAGNISIRHPNFRFTHYDVKDQLHNPLGVTRTAEIRLPVLPGSIDRVILWSVFTHMFRPDIVHYMTEFRRILKRDGLVFATCFLVNPEVLQAAQATSLQFSHTHDYEPGCHMQDAQRPLAAIAYTYQALEQMVAAAGLMLDRPIQQGVWSGAITKSIHWQDVMVLRLP
jgi:SAM-dependent methyltransferase